MGGYIPLRVDHQFKLPNLLVQVNVTITPITNVMEFQSSQLAYCWQHWGQDSNLPTNVHPLNQLTSTELAVHLPVALPKFIMAYHHRRGEKWWHTIHPLFLTTTTKANPLGHLYYRPRPLSTQQSLPNRSPNWCWKVSHRNPAQLGFSTHVP
jgi:hypothetical protein